MDTMATLTSYVKKTGGGLTAIAKHVSDAGTANLTEAQFTQLIGVEAAKRYPNDRSDVAFSKFFTAPENAIVRQAHAIIKNYPVLVNVKPMQTGGAAAVASADEGQAAYDKLMAMAAELARTNPALSISQAFSRVAAELKNKDLLAASVLRTRARATSAYPGQP